MADFTEEFDYVVVGAGSAGCVVAARLSESGAHTVALLEAGGEDDSFWIHAPLGYGKLHDDPRYNWLYESEPEPELGSARIFLPRGKVLGGTGSINGSVYTRGQREDFDHWRQLGNAGWSYEDVLPFFKKAEDNERGADDYHGAGGPLRVSDPPRHELAETSDIPSTSRKPCRAARVPALLSTAPRSASTTPTRSALPLATDRPTDSTSPLPRRSARPAALTTLKPSRTGAAAPALR